MVVLPSLEQTVDSRACALRGAVSPDGRLVARCGGELTEVFEVPDGSPNDAVPGCTPAWRPDGMLTVAQARGVVGFGSCSGGTPCSETLIEQDELHRAAAGHPSVPERPARLRVLVDGIAWVSGGRAAVLLSIRMGGRLAGVGALSEIAFFEDGRLVQGARTYTRTTGGRLAASRRGGYVTLTPDVILRPDGSQVSLPAHLRDGLAFAWSPDDRFVVLATPFAVHVLDVESLARFDETGFGLRSVTLPLRATDLAWR